MTTGVGLEQLSGSKPVVMRHAWRHRNFKLTARNEL